MSTEHAAEDHGHHEAITSTFRLETLSDGVFAIALTLLAIDLVAASKLPEGETGLFDHLLHEWPAPMAYMIGFLTILVCWINHRYLFTFVKRADAGLLWLNGLQLALVGAVALPTAILAEEITGDEPREALIIYGITFFLMAASFWVLTAHVRRRALTHPGRNGDHLDALRISYLLATLWTIACLAVAWFSMYPALVMWTLMFAVFAVPRESSDFVRRRLATRQSS